MNVVRTPDFNYFATPPHIVVTIYIKALILTSVNIIYLEFMPTLVAPYDGQRLKPKDMRGVHGYCKVFLIAHPRLEKVVYY